MTGSARSRASIPLTNRDGSAALLPRHPAIVRERVRHVGDTVAMVVAEASAPHATPPS